MREFWSKTRWFASFRGKQGGIRRTPVTRGAGRSARLSLLRCWRVSEARVSLLERLHDPHFRGTTLWPCERFSSQSSRMEKRFLTGKRASHRGWLQSNCRWRREIRGMDWTNSSANMHFRHWQQSWQAYPGRSHDTGIMINYLYWLPFFSRTGV